MFEAYLDSVPFPVIAVLKSRNALVIPARRTHPVRVVVLPRLVGGLPTLRIRTIFTYCLLLRNAASVSVVGADIMDGGYDRRESIFRSRALVIAARFRVPGRVLGFSWNGLADRLTVKSLRRASKSAMLYARDPVSHARLCSDNMSNLELAADAAFVLLKDEADEGLHRWLSRSPTAPLAIVNASGLIMQSMDLTDDYVAIVQSLLAKDYRVVLLPHVLRNGDDDRLACGAIADRVTHPDVYLVDRKLSPGSISWLASQADIAVSGRMHLGILAMNRGIPCITLSTQGKVEGLLQMFDLPALCVQPAAGMSAAVILLAEHARAPGNTWNAAILATLPHIRSLAKQNYAGLNRNRTEPARQ